jgi:hypothetical protein
MAGPRYEQFSMQAAAAISGLGVALMPTLLELDLLNAPIIFASLRPLQKGSSLQKKASVF